MNSLKVINVTYAQYLENKKELDDSGSLIEIVDSNETYKSEMTVTSCPNCGAPLNENNVNWLLSTPLCTCEYCGSRVRV